MYVCLFTAGAFLVNRFLRPKIKDCMGMQINVKSADCLFWTTLSKRITKLEHINQGIPCFYRDLDFR